jgi:hypothetical protein
MAPVAWPRAGGISVLSFEPLAVRRRLAPHIPPPYTNLVPHDFFGNGGSRAAKAGERIKPDELQDAARYFTF